MKPARRVRLPRVSAGTLCLLAWTAGCVGSPNPPTQTPPAACPPPLAQSQEPELVPAEQEGVPKPIVRQHNYTIEWGEFGLEVDPTDGGRIVRFALDGRSVVIPKSESAAAYGSSFWTSPQSDWGWPPPKELDTLPWKVSVEGETLVLESDKNERLGLYATQRLTADRERDALVIEFTLKNDGPTQRSVAPWQNTRVRAGGLTFFPSHSGTLPHSELALQSKDGVVWFAHDPSSFKDNKKIFADGQEGWLAQVDGDLLFVKVFPDIPLSAHAPGEAEIEIYVDGGGTFVEMEQQGAYEPLSPGGESHWKLHWFVRRIASHIERTPGSVELLRMARELARSVKELPTR